MTIAPRIRLLALAVAVALIGPVAAPAAAADPSIDITSPSATTALPPLPSMPSLPEDEPEARRAEAVISGTVRLADVPGADHEEPRNDLYRVEAWDEHHLVSSAAVIDGRYDVEYLEAGRSYFVRLVSFEETRASVWFGGSAVSAGALPVRAPTLGLELVSPAVGALFGEVSGGGEWQLTAFYRDPTTNGLHPMASAWASDGSAFSMQGLPPGRYVLMGSPTVGGRDTFWPSGSEVGDAKDIEIAPGAVTNQLRLSRDTSWEWSTSRAAGQDRYATSVESTKLAFQPGIPVLYVANGANWPDALSASPAAATQGGALLLTDPNALPAVVATEIRRLAPQRIVVVGDERSITASTYAQIAALAPSISRIGGKDRYETSRKIVADAFSDDASYNRLFVATGTNYPDALSIAPIAGQYNEPVLLVDGGSAQLDDAGLAAVNRIYPDAVVLVGGLPSISAGIETQLQRTLWDSTIHRLAGTDRYDTSRMIQETFGQSPLQHSVFFAQGYSWADALAGATTAAAMGSSIILTPKECVRQSTLDLMYAQSHEHAILLGSTPSLSEDVAKLVVCAA